MNRPDRLLAVAALAVLLAGCQTPQSGQTGAPIENRAAAGAAGAGSGASTAGAGGAGVAGTQTPGRAGSAGTSGSGGSAAGAGSALRDPASILSKRSVYFDFDSFVVKDESRPIIAAHGRYLVANRGARMTIQGNTDERGSREYNIALGQKRADAMKRMMTLIGAQESQVETVSFGKEKPRRSGHDETSWAENRRGDIVYSGE